MAGPRLLLLRLLPDHRTHRTDKLVHTDSELVNTHSELVDTLIGLDATFGKRNHYFVEALNVIGELFDSPRKRTHNGFKAGQALVMPGLIAQQEFNGFLDVHVLMIRYCSCGFNGAGGGLGGLGMVRTGSVSSVDLRTVM